MTSITWLHLSDWHQRGNEFDRKVVRDALVEDIRQRNEISQDLTQIDFIVFSGDVAHSGKKEEYETAIKEFFDPVLEAAGLEKSKHERLFIVPGNHDLDRDKFELLPEGLKQPLKDHSEVQKWLANKNPAMLSRVLDPFEEYRKFVNGYTKQTTPDYANILRLEIAGKKVALLGINSALMAGRNRNKDNKVDDYGKLIVGEPQIYDTLNQIDEYDLRIAVLHHPLEWLSEFDQRRVRMRLVKECHFILCGHQHEPGFYQVQELDGNYLIIPAGATYDTGEYPNSYNFVHIDFENDEGKIYLRLWDQGKRDWIRYDAAYPMGEYTFDIPTNKDKLQQVSLSNCSKLVEKLVKQQKRMDVWKKLHKEWQKFSCELAIERRVLREKSPESAYAALKSWSSSKDDDDQNFYVRKIKELLLRLDNMSLSNIVEDKEISDIITNYYSRRPDHPSTIINFIKYIEDDLKNFELTFLTKYEEEFSGIEVEYQQLQKDKVEAESNSRKRKIENKIEDLNKKKELIEGKKEKKIQDIVIRTLNNIQSIEQKSTQFLQCLDDNLQKGIHAFRDLLSDLQNMYFVEKQ